LPRFSSAAGPHVVHVDLRTPAAAAMLDGGWYGAERAWELSGRWTSGAGALVVPRAGRHVSAVRAAVCAHPARGADQLRIAAGPFETTVRVLQPGCQIVHVPVHEALPDRPDHGRLLLDHHDGGRRSASARRVRRLGRSRSGRASADRPQPGPRAR
jgi:hypothetical protein